MKSLIFWSSTSQRVYVTTLCYCSLLLLFLTTSPSQVYGAREKKRERSPLYESSERNYHHGDIDQLAHHHPSGLSQPAAYNDHKLALSATHDVEQHAVSTTAKPKSYAFGYLVRDPIRDDHFAHKERRDGKVTVGEYSVVLPDGRTQTVRYTSDSVGGFKADVTYEGEENENYFQMHHPSPSPPSPSKPVAIPQTQPQYLPSSPSPHNQPQYQPSGPTPQQQQTQSPQYYDDLNGDLYRKYTPTSNPNPTPSYRGGSITRGRNPSPTQSSKTKNPVYLSYPLKAQRPSSSPSVIYKTESGHFVDQKGNQYSHNPSPSPSPVYYSQNSNPSPSPTQGYYSQNSNPSPSPSQSPGSYTKINPTSGSYRSGAIPGNNNNNNLKYYPSPSPNSLYSNGNPVGISGPSRPVKFSSGTSSRNPSKSVSTNYRNVPTKTYPSSASQQNLQHLTSSGQLPGPTPAYRPIPRGHRAGPDPTYYSKSPSPSPSSSPTSSSGGRFINRGPSSITPTYAAESSEHLGEEYSNYNHHPNAHHLEDIEFSHSNTNVQKAASSRRGSKLIPIEFFKAGPATTKATTLEKQKQKSIKKFYSPSPSPSSASQVSTIFDSVSNHNDVYDSFNNHNHVSSENISPYSTNDHISYYNTQPHQQQQVNISPVKSSVATYTSNYLGITPKPNLFESTSSPGIPVGRPIRPSVGGLTYLENPEQKSRIPQTRTYDPHDPSFGNSVSYSSSSNDNGKRQRDSSSSQFSHTGRHDGIVREYLVEKKFGHTPGYEDELA